MKTKQELEDLDIENAFSQSQKITHDAKYLEYPVVELQVKLSNLAEDVGLQKEIEYYLDQITEALHKLQSACFQCDEVFEEALIRKEELEEMSNG
tara:strand:+ start:207 stop:491 length:285 start_codon:yes stop_codon:yes gene_type:complete